MLNKWRAITACTPDYVDEATCLSTSCIEHGVPFTIYPYIDKGNWVLNCEHTVQIIYDALEESHGVNILWLDADSIMNSYPFLFDNFKFNIGVYKRKNTEAYAKRHQDNSGYHYESGTIFYANRKETRLFVATQLGRLMKYDNVSKFDAVTPMKLFDYPSTNHMLRAPDCKLTIGELPVSYHWPMNNPQPDEQCDKPVIIQDMVGSSKRRKR